MCVSCELAGGRGLCFPANVTVSLKRFRRPHFVKVGVTKPQVVVWLPFRAMRSPEKDSDQPPEGPGAPSEGGSPGLGPLPSGRHPYTPEQVARHQRERLIAGLAAAVSERGYAATTIGQIAAAAHVSRRVFYEHFETKEECYLAAFDAVFAHLRTLMAAAGETHADDWPRQVIAALGAALDFFASEPDLARLCLSESPGAGPALQRRFREVADTFDPYMAAGRAEQAGGHPMPESTEVSLIGALGFKLNRQIAAAGAESLPGQLPALAEFLLTPYLGAARARQLALEVEEGQEG
jgi:AcrR family transcriptional regulator